MVLARQIADRLHSAAIHLLRRAATVDSGMRLDGPRASLLSILVFGGPQPMSRLAEMERVTPAAITKLVTALERDGLAVRVRDRVDRRVVRVEATSVGARVLREGRAARVRLIEGLLEGLSKADLATLGRAAEILDRVVTSSPVGSSPVGSPTVGSSPVGSSPVPLSPVADPGQRLTAS